MQRQIGGDLRLGHDEWLDGTGEGWERLMWKLAGLTLVTPNSLFTVVLAVLEEKTVGRERLEGYEGHVWECV